MNDGQVDGADMKRLSLSLFADSPFLPGTSRERKGVRPNLQMRWLMVLWLAVTFGASVLVLGNTLGFRELSHLLLSWQVAPLPTLPAIPNYPQSLVPFEMLMAIHMVLHWWSSQICQKRWHDVGYAICQGGIVLAMTLLYPAESSQLFLILSLLLALTVEAVTLLERPYAIFAASFWYLTLFGVYLSYTLRISIDSGRALVSNFSYFLLSVVPLILFAVGYVMSYSQRVKAHEHTQLLVKQLAAAHVEVAAYAGRVESLTRTAERQRLARELHDTLSQGLTGIIMQLEVVDTHLTLQNPSRAHELIHQAMRAARETLAGSRAAIHELRDTSTFADTFTHRIRQFTEMTGIGCDVTLEWTETIPRPYQETVYHFLSEGLANVAQHAQARQVGIALSRDDHWMQVTLQDDGVGFAPTIQTDNPGHYGLVGLHERADLIKGSVIIKSRPGVGTTLHLLLPLS
jgi:NarL family two-component system sensor histidine kinase YdfH